MSLIDSDTVTANLVSRTEVREMRGRYTRLSRVSPVFTLACAKRFRVKDLNDFWYDWERERERVETLNLIATMTTISNDRIFRSKIVVRICFGYWWALCVLVFEDLPVYFEETYKYRKANPGIRSNRSSIFMGWLTNSSFHFIIDYRARFDECCECVTVFSLIVALLIPTRVIKNRYKEYFFFFRQRKRTKRVQKLFTFILRITEIIDDVSR